MVRNVLTYLAVIAGIVVFSGFFVFIFANSTEIQCLREAGREPACSITKKFLGRVPISDRDVLGVTDVQMDESCDEDGCSYRAELVTSAGRSVPVNDVYTSRGLVLRQIGAFEAFLSGTDTSFSYVEPVSWWVVGMILAMDLVGLVIVSVSFLRKARAGQA